MTNSDRKTKILGIGLSRTGTQSLAVALRMLGYRTIHYPRSLADVERHDAALDLPVVHWYPFLDRVYPGSRFVLTTRDEQSWLVSCRKHYAAPWRQKPPAAFTIAEQEVATVDREVYGSWQFNEEAFLGVKRSHEAFVRSYFADRPDDLLVLDVVGLGSQQTWRCLCRFLCHDEIPFPWENRSEPQ